MRSFLHIILLGTALSLGGASIAPAYAVAVFDEHDDALKAIRNGEVLPYSKIKRTTEKKLKGKIVGERLRRTNRGWVYELRVRENNSGRVLFVVVDAANGAILRTK